MMPPKLTCFLTTIKLKPYVSIAVRLTKGEERAVFGKFSGPRGLTAQHFLKVARECTSAETKLAATEKIEILPSSLSEAEVVAEMKEVEKPVEAARL